jgi:hypothetical protein
MNSPSPDVAKDIIIIVQSAITEIKQSVILGGDARSIIDKWVKEIKDDILREETRKSLLIASRKWEYERQVTISVLSNGAIADSRMGFRGFLDNARIGTPTIDDYQRQLKLAIKALAAEPPKVYTRRDGRVVQIPLRNRAEMLVRYEVNIKEVAELAAKGVEYVWITSHANASPRCAPYQGRLYSINANNRSGTHDGIKYEYLPDILKLNDGNSILNGYNCRHRAVEYFKGSKPPEEYSSREIKREYAIDTKQRNYENSIRQMRTEERLMRDAGLTDDADALGKKWKILNKKYEIFSLRNKRTIYNWRTQIEVMEGD